MTPGRRLRLDRRKAGLSQAELAKKLGHTPEEVSAMENDRLALSGPAQAFSASIPARVPKAKDQAAPKPEEPQTGGDEPGGPEEEQEGAGPRVELPDGPTKPEGGDKPPRASRSVNRELPPARGEIAELEDALLKMFAGEHFLVPRKTPEGIIQVEASIPGIAQIVGMYDEFDGQIIQTYAPGMAKAWAELARVNPGVRRILNGLTYGGAYRGVMAASLPPLVAILAHHGAIPGFGGPGAQAVVDHPPPQPEGPLFGAQVG
jgi:hypothetical protein